MHGLLKELYNFKIGSKSLFRSDGRLNSPLLKNFKKSELYILIKEFTPFLEDNASVSQRLWHVINNRYSYKICSCGKQIIKWHKGYSNFCSQKCATTSDSSKERARQQMLALIEKGKIKLRTKGCIGHKRSSVTKQLLSSKKMGVLNPRYGKVPWNKGLFGSENPNFGKKRPNAKRLYGPDNPMYGKSPSKKVGYGIWGAFNGVHFRSSLELFYLMYWHEQHIEVESAEQDFFKMTYLIDDRWHTYTPDFYLYNDRVIVEIKPERLQDQYLTLIKFSTLKYYFEDRKCLMLGYSEIKDFITDSIINNKINRYIGYELVIPEKQLNRLIKNYGDILREVNKIL